MYSVITTHASLARVHAMYTVWLRKFLLCVQFKSKCWDNCNQLISDVAVYFALWPSSICNVCENTNSTAAKSTKPSIRC